MSSGRREPQQLSQVLSELIALRGLAKVQGGGQLQQAWSDAAGSRFAAATRVLKLNGGVLQVAVGNSPLLSELASFEKDRILQTFQKKYPTMRVTDIKFRLKGDLKPGAP